MPASTSRDSMVDSLFVETRTVKVERSNARCGGLMLLLVGCRAEERYHEEYGKFVPIGMEITTKLG